MLWLRLDHDIFIAQSVLQVCTRTLVIAPNKEEVAIDLLDAEMAQIFVSEKKMPGRDK